MKAMAARSVARLAMALAAWAAAPVSAGASGEHYVDHKVDATGRGSGDAPYFGDFLHFGLACAGELDGQGWGFQHEGSFFQLVLEPLEWNAEGRLIKSTVNLRLYGRRAQGNFDCDITLTGEATWDGDGLTNGYADPGYAGGFTAHLVVSFGWSPFEDATGEFDVRGHLDTPSLWDSGSGFVDLDQITGTLSVKVP